MCCESWCVEPSEASRGWWLDCGEQRQSLVEIGRVSVGVEQHYLTRPIDISVFSDTINNVMSATIPIIASTSDTYHIH
jgi:hypothetical protein